MENWYVHKRRGSKLGINANQTPLGKIKISDQAHNQANRNPIDSFSPFRRNVNNPASIAEVEIKPHRFLTDWFQDVIR